MKEQNKITNRVDKAFSQALELIGLKRGKSKKNVCVRIRFLGEKKAMEIGLFTLKSIKRLNYWEVFSPKLMALRFSLEDFYCSLQAFYQMTKERYKVTGNKDIALLLYESAKEKKPILVGCVDGELKHSMYVSDLLAILGMGDEQLN